MTSCFCSQGIPRADTNAGDCVFGTKARSVIRKNDPVGIEAIVTQQFDVAARVIRRGLVPIIEPEVDIDCADKVSPSAI
jgi:fructose-bisphosphate aldolase class I